ncbi:hypothetical protein FKG94_06700 [Exilibacterium tricleocarpae]|uniref:Uncharacterized protein n=1 Tax=Exilibacterium tricleocarpae TaxID=2591008 RepID=A0A545TYX5_9GAMM|nr:hypothetical protein [Exilibacterium tricleocarpae]TQV82429.1 hypothetical protein FKG94_06700 [Exilibacterium tricleocarpae]
MAVSYKKVLAVLLRLLETAFSNSSVNRKVLHELEWQAEEGGSSVLGEVEVRADTVIGIARTCLRKQPENINELTDALEESSVYRSEVLIDWLANSGDEFPDFCSYIAAIENLRTCTITFLRGSLGN